MMANFSLWWDAMNITEKIYWCIAIPFSVLFVIQLVTTFFLGDVDGMDAGGNADLSMDSDAGIDFQFLSIKNLIAFFTIFGWTGIACIHGEVSLVVTIVLSLLAGLVMMVIMATIMYYMAKLAENGSLDLNNAKGKTGTVYLPVPGNRKGQGQIQVKVQGFQTLDAMTDEAETIPTGTLVEVVDVINNEILIVKSFK
jgi:membrane protein implicated in regulation of membrane protease activity